MKCQLCSREVLRLTIHHLIPKDEKGKYGPRINICPPCHRQIHSLFDNKLLARELNTLKKLQDHPEIQKFLLWVQKQTPDKRIKVHKKKYK